MRWLSLMFLDKPEPEHLDEGLMLGLCLAMLAIPLMLGGLLIWTFVVH